MNPIRFHALILLGVLWIGAGISSSWAEDASVADKADKKDPSLEIDYLKLRDPFLRPRKQTREDRRRSDLEVYNVEQFRLVGVMTGPGKTRAMVVAPNSKTYFISEADRIGVNNGRVVKILPDLVLVQEKILNVLGQEEKLVSEIRMGAIGIQQNDVGGGATPGESGQGEQYQ